MKIHLDMAPIWDAYRAGGECPFCNIQTLLEAQFVDAALGGSVMEPDTRIRVNRQGFCAHHFQLLYAQPQRLGLGLMTHTYSLETLDLLKKAWQDKQASDNRRGRKRDTPDPILALLDQRLGDCILCAQLTQNMHRYARTMLHMYFHESAFPKMFEQSRGLCLPHLRLIYDTAGQTLSARHSQQFLPCLMELQLRHMQRLSDEVEWFTLKFDQKNRDKPWNESRDALPRIIGKLSGKTPQG